jgi:hypothetical protein
MSNEETDKLLSDRYKLYGEHADQAFISQSIKRVFQNTRNWRRLSDVQKECLEMVANKLGRILNGDPDYIDSWDDVAGYIRLVTQRLGPEGRALANKWAEESGYSGAVGTGAGAGIDQ